MRGLGNRSLGGVNPLACSIQRRRGIRTDRELELGIHADVLATVALRCIILIRDGADWKVRPVEDLVCVIFGRIPFDLKFDFRNATPVSPISEGSFVVPRSVRLAEGSLLRRRLLGSHQCIGLSCIGVGKGLLIWVWLSGDLTRPLGPSSTKLSKMLL